MVGVILNTARKLALKIASYGVMHLVVAILVAFAITRDWRLALAVGVVEPIFQTIAYSIHDRVWHRVERRRLASGIEEATVPSPPASTSCRPPSSSGPMTPIAVTATPCPARSSRWR